MYPKHNPYPNNRDNIYSIVEDSSGYLDVFKGKPFWIWDEKKHDRLYYTTQGHCCANHILGLPKKNGKEYPLFDWQEQIYNALELYSNLSILKSRGIGITTFIIRYLAWKILFDDRMDNKSVFIISGTREEHANYVKERLKQLFEFTFPDLNIQSKYTELWLKNTWIKIFPSKNIEALRGYMDTHTVWLDESDYLDLSVQQELMNAIIPYQEKSNCNIILTSTPNMPNGLMQQIESDTNFKKLRLDYKVGLGTIYQQSEIDKLKDRPEFQREYCCAFGYGLGNVFLPSDIEKSISPKEYKYNSACSVSIGIDPGFGSSKFAITVLQYEDSIIKVLYAKQWDRPSYEDMINQVVKLTHEYNPTKIYVDSANPDFIKSVKIQFRDNPDYESVIEQANHENIDPEYRMLVCPVAFSQYGKELLGRFQYFVSKGWFSVPSTFDELTMDMRTASYLDNGNLDKKTVGNRTFDLLDSTRLALKLYEKSDKR
jgi:hypothetical protein